MRTVGLVGLEAEREADEDGRAGGVHVMNRVEGPYQSRSPAPPSKCFMTLVIRGGLRAKAQGRGENQDAVEATLYSILQHTPLSLLRIQGAITANK